VFGFNPINPAAERVSIEFTLSAPNAGTKKTPFELFVSLKISSISL
jgi:hypothetical protein